MQEKDENPHRNVTEGARCPRRFFNDIFNLEKAYAEAVETTAVAPVTT